MSSKKYLGVLLACLPILLFTILSIILLNTKENTAENIEEDWTNIAELPQEFLDNYFDEYAEMRKDADPDNILMVTSKSRPNAYGAVGIVLRKKFAKSKVDFDKK